MTQTETQPERRKEELAVYPLATWDFKSANIYAMGGPMPNARHIASQYGCELEFRASQFEPGFRWNFAPSFLREYGIDIDGSCLSAVLVGEDRKQLAKARDDIHRTLGKPKSISHAKVYVGNDVIQ